MEEESSTQPQMIQPINVEEIETFAQGLKSDDEKVLLDTVIKIKHMLYTNPNAELETRLDKLIELGVLERLIEIFKGTNDFHLKYNCIWTFVNVCCGNTTQINKAVKAGVLDLSVDILDDCLNDTTDNNNLFELALESVWLIGNVAGDSIEHRDECHDRDSVQKIVQLVQKYPDHEKLLDNAIWTLQNLVSKKPAPFWNQISEAFKLFITLLGSDKSVEVQYHALWGICYISASYIVDVYESGCIPDVIIYLKSDQAKLIFPALQILGNVISSTRDTYTDEVLKNPNFLPLLFKLCHSEEQRIKIYATWAISNIAAGSPDQIANIIKNSKYIDDLAGQLQEDDDKVKYQASCALANLVFRATPDQIEELVTKQNYLDALLQVMKQEDVLMYERNIIDPIEKILKADHKRKFAPIFKHKGLIEQMNEINSNFSFEMRMVANQLVNKHLTNISDTPTITVTAADTAPVAAPAAAVIASKTAPKSPKKSPQKSPQKSPSKVPKVSTSKKIQKAPKTKKLPIKRTKTMAATLEEAKTFIKGMKRNRTRKSSKPAAAPKKETTSAKKGDDKEKKVPKVSLKKIKRTNTMKQTLSEAKKILKQIDKQAKKAKK